MRKRDRKHEFIIQLFPLKMLLFDLFDLDTNDYLQSYISEIKNSLEGSPLGVKQQLLKLVSLTQLWIILRRFRDACDLLRGALDVA